MTTLAIAFLFGASAQDVGALIEQVASSDPAVHEPAMQELAGAGEDALPALRNALARATDDAVRDRLQRVIDAIDKPGRYGVNEAETRIEWRIETSAYRPTRQTIVVLGDGSVTLTVEPLGGGEPLHREEFRLKPEERERMFRVFLEADFLDMDPPTAPDELYAGGITWHFTYAPAEGEGRTIDSPGNVPVPENLRAIHEFFDGMIAHPETYRAEEE